jgi:cytochrome c oxidase cbb3-type subunit 4
MDINDLRSIVTVVSFVTFLGIVAWAFSGRRKTAFDEAARLPLDDDEFERVNVNSVAKTAEH